MKIYIFRVLGNGDEHSINISDMISTKVLTILAAVLLVFSAMNFILILSSGYATGKASGIITLEVQEKPSVPSGPSGPSGPGPVITPPEIPAPPAECIENWQCTDWPTICPDSGIQTRNCTELNECLTENETPQQQRFCIVLNAKHVRIRLTPGSAIVSIALAISEFFNSLLQFILSILSFLLKLILYLFRIIISFFSRLLGL